MLCVLALALSAPAQAQAKQPNIVLILADDYGVGDLRAYWPDGKIASPKLDELAAEGMRFTDAHSASAVCTPTRYGLMTGRYSWRTRLQAWVLPPHGKPLIKPDQMTLASLLQDQGYATGCIGKWHLGMNWPKKAGGGYDYSGELTGGPVDRGFDYYFGTYVPNFPPFTFIENRRITIQPTATYQHDPSLHMAQRARGHEVAVTGAPMAPDWQFTEILPTITDRAVQYIQQQAKTEQPFFLYYSMTTPHEPVSPSEEYAGITGIDPIADLVRETNASAGRVIEAIDESGIGDDTLVIFTADNGHSHYTGWQALINAGHQPSGPYRGHKGDIWEGGHRVPFIARWPGEIEAGTTSDQMLSLNDLLRTFAAIVDVSLPASAGEDSFNMWPVLRGERDKPVRKTLISHDVDGRFAIRDGPWKLVILAKKQGEPRLELYNLQKNIAEQRNVASEHPARVKRMLELLREDVERGRSYPGQAQSNDVPIDVMHLPKHYMAKTVE
jgi:arylsulfatase A-like enzyme